MFGGECWITKIYTVLADCTTNHYTCCQGYQIAGHVTKGKNIHCVKQSGCGGVKRLTKNNGELTTLNYPSHYDSNLSCEWEIIAPIGSRIRVEFKEFETEDNPQCQFDNLQIMDSMMERTFCGRRLPNPVFSASNYLNLKFVTDAHGQFKGFRALYSFISDSTLNQKCHNDKVWQPCLCKTIPTCGNPYPSDCEDVDCGAGCACPPERHILWNNQCITIEQCPEHKINSEYRCGSLLKGSQASTRIIGGESSDEGEWPWAVQLLRYRNLVCGATLIASNWVVSAAHCFLEHAFLDLKTKNYLITLGATKRVFTSFKTDTIEMMVPSLIQPHPRFSYETNSHDIALIGLPRSVQFSNYIQPACLPKPTHGMPQEGDQCLVIGWGKTQEGGQLAKTLQKLELDIEKDSLCQNIYLIYSPITQICVGGGDLNRDTCQGDSGGPLLCDNTFDDGWTIHGITSFGTSCGVEPTPGVYTRVQFYLSWIESICGPKCSLPVSLSPSVVTATKLNIAAIKMATGQSTSSTSDEFDADEKKLKQRVLRRIERQKQRQQYREHRALLKAAMRARRISERKARKRSG